MKLKTVFFYFCCLAYSSAALAADAGLRYINNRGYVICGTDLSGKTLAYRDEAKIWWGIDADICRTFAHAILGNPESFKLRDVPADKIAWALDNNKVDIMLGNNVLSAKQEITKPINAVDILYYDKQVFASRKKTNSSSMEDFKGSKVCVLANSMDLANLNEFNHRYALGFKILEFPNLNAAKEAFYLNRCQLISGSEIYLKGIANSLVAKNDETNVLPEIISYRPIFAYVHKDNSSLRITTKWIINALKLAEQQGMNSKNVNTFIGLNDPSLRNLLGVDMELWKEFGVYPDWVKKAVEQRGNYGEIYERNLGEDSPLQIERKKNYLLEKGGLISAQPFL